MSVEAVGVTVIIVTFVLMFLRIPISVAMAVPTCIAITYMKGWNTVFTAMETIIWESSYHYTLSTIPLFTLMGYFLLESGISQELFVTFRKWFGRLKGGLAVASIGSSAVFSTATGSSLAVVSTIGPVASQEMMKAGYNKTLISGSIVAGGTLGILIPPSTAFIIYGMMTEQSIGKLLIAGILPGILLALLYVAVIFGGILLRPSLVQSSDTVKVSWKEKLISLKSNFWIAVLFIIVIGGIYAGVFTATEAAGVGALGAFIITLVRRKMTVAVFIDTVMNATKTTGFIFAIIIGAYLLNYVVSITRIPQQLGTFLLDRDLNQTVFFIIVIAMYVLLGMIMDTLTMIVVTIPILLPILEMYGFDLVWFGVIIVLVIEMAMISPPVGMILFLLRGIAPELGMGSVLKGGLLFMIPILILVALLYLFPEIALYLPNNVK